MEKWDIVKSYREDFPVCRFVGKKYKNSDRVDGMYGFYWDQWHENNWFQALEELLDDTMKTDYPETEGFIGLMKNRYGEDENYFEYWIGMFLPSNCIVPEGYDYIDLNYTAAGISWVKGKGGEVFCKENECYHKLIEAGMKVRADVDGGCYFFERYNCPRFTVANEDGDVILDIGYFVE